MEKREDFLSGKRIRAVKLKTFSNVLDIIEGFDLSGAYNAGRLAEACRVYEKMVRAGSTVAVTLAGAFTPTGLGSYIIHAIERGLIDMIISTGANLYHDMHFALNLPLYQGSPSVDDEKLLKYGIVRIYDIFIPDETLFETDKVVQRFVYEISEKVNTPLSTSDFHYLLGRWLLENAPNPEESILATAAKYNVPIYAPSPGDSSIGMNVAKAKIDEKSVVIDPDLDVLETAAIVYCSGSNGVIVLGGGSPKNFYFQTQPMIDQILGIGKGGHDYVIQLTVDVPQYGGLSGATLGEAVSWGKIRPREDVNKVTIYMDTTVSAPLLFSYMFSKNYVCSYKNIYLKRKGFLERLKEACDRKKI